MNCPTKEQVLETAKKTKSVEVADALKSLFPDVFEAEEEVVNGQFFYYDEGNGDNPSIGSFILIEDYRFKMRGRFSMFNIFSGKYISSFTIKDSEKLTFSRLSSIAKLRGCFNIRHPKVGLDGIRGPAKIAAIKFRSVYKQKGEGE